MKKILVTGAAGMVGVAVCKYLLLEGNYEITALDLKTRKSFNNLKRFKSRINIVYGDVTDPVLMGALVKSHDVIIHLASSPYVLANMKKELAMHVDYGGTLNIIKAINKYNPKCFLMYSSSMSIYPKEKVVLVEDSIKIKDNIYNYYKYETEKVIKEKLANYTIYRFPLILGDIRYDHLYFNGQSKQDISLITKEDAAYSLVRGLKYLDKLNKKTFNVVDKEVINYQELIQKILLTYGLTFNYVLTKIFIDKDYSSPTCLDKEKLNDLIDYQNDTLKDYFTKLKRKTKKRKVPIFLAKVFIWRKK